MNTGEKIKVLRANKKWTQKKLAEESGIHEVQIRRYESGSITPKIKNLTKIADALGVPYTELADKSTLEENTSESDLIKSLTISSQDKKEIRTIIRKLKDIGYLVVEESLRTTGGQSLYTITFSDVSANSILLDLDQMKELNKETNNFLKFKIESYKNKETT